MKTTRVLPYAWFAALALAVAAPLLGGGRLLLLDYVSGPALFEPDLLPLPSEGRPANEVPTVAVLDLLGHVHPLLPDKVLLLAPILLAGVGAYRLAARRLELGIGPSFYAGTLYALNPFVLDRYLAGHLLFLVGYGLMPWAVVTADRALRTSSGRRALGVGAWAACLAAVSLHAAGLFALVVAALALLADAPVRGRVATLGVALVSGAVLSAYWWLPASVQPGAATPLAGELEAYASRPHGWPVLASLLSLHGFWRDEFVAPAEAHPWLFLLLAPIVVLAALGLVTSALRAGDRSTIVGLGLAGAIGVVVSASTAFPGMRGLYQQLPGATLYREPQKLLALTVLAYAVLGAGALSGRRWSPLLAAAATAVAVGYGHGLVWGLGGHVELARYPAGWKEAARRMEQRGPGRVLVLPWRAYAAWSFTGGRIVANPTRSYFARDVLLASDAGTADVASRTRDPLALLIGLRPRETTRPRLLAAAGVRFVLLLKEADWRRLDLRSLRRLHRVVYEDRSVLLLENRAWKPAPRGVSAIAAKPPVIDPADGGLGFARALPGWRQVGPTSAPWLVTDDRCTDGWRLGGAAPVCHLGVVAAYPGPTRREPLWRPAGGLAVLGYGLSFAGVAVLLAGRVRRLASREGKRVARKNT